MKDMSEFDKHSLVHHEPFAIIRACGLCEGASEKIVRFLSNEAHLSHADRGETLWSAGSNARFFCIVADGLLRLVRRAPPAHEIVVELVGPGSCAGILAALSKGPYPLTASAVIPTTYLKLPIDIWRNAMEIEPRLCDNAMRELRCRLVQSYDFLGGMTTAMVEKRLVSALLSVHSALKSPFFERDENLPISRQSLAEIASTSVETTIRTTTKWQQAGWIDAGYRTIRILDMDALRSLLA